MIVLATAELATLLEVATLVVAAEVADEVAELVLLEVRDELVTDEVAEEVAELVLLDVRELLVTDEVAELVEVAALDAVVVVTKLQAAKVFQAPS